MIQKITIDKGNPKFEMPVHGGFFTEIMLESIYAAEVPKKETGYINVCAVNSSDLFTNRLKDTNVCVMQFVSLPLHSKGHVFNSDLLVELKAEAERQGKEGHFNKLIVRPPFDFLETGNSFKIVLRLNKTGSYVAM